MKREGLAGAVEKALLDADSTIRDEWPTDRGAQIDLSIAAAQKCIAAIRDALAAHEAREVVRWDCPECGWSTHPTDPLMTRHSAQADHDADDETIIVECRAKVRALVEI